MTEDKNFWTKSLLEKVATIRTLHFMWKFPFIKIVDFTGTMNDMQKAVNKQMNIILDNKAKNLTLPFNNKKNKLT